MMPIKPKLNKLGDNSTLNCLTRMDRLLPFVKETKFSFLFFV